MSRVISGTFRPLALAGLLPMVLGLAACGGDGGSAAAPASDPTPIPASAQQGASTPGTETASVAAAGAESSKREVLHPDVAVTKEGARAVARADSTRVEDAAFGKQVDQVATSLEKADFKVVINRGVADSPTVLRTDGYINVMIFRSDKLAARLAASYVSILSAMKNEGRVARKDNVVVTLLPINGKEAISDASLERFHDVRHAAT